MTTTSSPTNQAAALAYIIELHLRAEAPDRPDRYYWERSAALTMAEIAGLLPAERQQVVATIQRHVSTALTALVGRFGDMDIEEVNRPAEQIVRELS